MLEDTGAGMGPEILGRAFEPLFTTKSKGMGTGLGLPQVFAFCERAGGVATIDSAVGAGTSVRLYLPRASATATESADVQHDHDGRGVAGFACAAGGGQRGSCGRHGGVVIDDESSRHVCVQC